MLLTENAEAELEHVLETNFVQSRRRRFSHNLFNRCTLWYRRFISSLAYMLNNVDFNSNTTNKPAVGELEEGMGSVRYQCYIDIYGKGAIIITALTLNTANFGLDEKRKAAANLVEFITEEVIRRLKSGGYGRAVQMV